MADILGLQALLGRVAKSLERLEASADDAAEKKLPTALAAVSGQLHKGIEVAAKLQGIGTPDSIPAGPTFSISIHLPQSVPLKGVQTFEGEIVDSRAPSRVTDQTNGTQAAPPVLKPGATS